jgi:OOP family OmpA-OmpF porin
MEAIRVIRSPFAAALGLVTVLGSAHAQLVHRGGDPWQPPAPSAFAASPGLQLSRVEYPIGCGASLLRCEPGQVPSFAAAATTSPLQWNLELSQLSLGAADRLAVGSARQGLNLSLVGRRALFGSSFSVYGKLGATYGYAEGAGSPLAVTPATQDQGYGLSYGAGVSLDFTPQLSATLGWGSHDLRLGGVRDGFRATSLGLQYRY